MILSPESKEHTLNALFLNHFLTQSKWKCTCMYLFFVSLMWECQKGKLSIDLNYFLQSDISTISFQNERKTKRHFLISNRKLLSALQILTIQIKYMTKSTINHLEEEDFTTLFFLTQNDSYDTFCIKTVVWFKLLFDEGL